MKTTIIILCGEFEHTMTKEPEDTFVIPSKGDIITFGHMVGYKYSKKRFKVVLVEVDLDEPKITLTCEDI